MNTDEREERLKQIQERQDSRREFLYGQDIDFLLSLLDSQVAGRSAREIAADIVREWSEHDMNEHYNNDYLRDEFGAGHLEERIALAVTFAATRMRDLCVTHLQATADALDVRQETECPSGTGFNSEATLRRRIATELESLTLDQVEQK